MNDRLNEILSTINGFYQYIDVVAHQYIALLNEAIVLINDIDAYPTSMLEDAKYNAVTELSNELANRMNERFFKAHLERRKNEFKISKVLVTVAIGNVLSNMQKEDFKNNSDTRRTMVEVNDALQDGGVLYAG